MAISWKTEKRKIDDLIPTEGNPRRMTEKQKEDLRASLEKFNLVEIPAINTDNRIISGHQRLKILQLLGRGQEEIDVRVPDRTLTEEEHREYLLRANKNLGEWDYDLLANFDEDILKDVGFESEDLDKIFDLDASEDDFNVEEELKKPAKTKLGDLYQLGEYRLLCGDSTKKEDVERLMGGEKADMLFCDPPYGIDLDTDFVSIHKGHTTGQKHNKVIGDEGKWDFSRSNWFDCKEQFWWGADFYLDNFKEGSWFVWDKTCGRFIGRIGNEFELCWSKQKHKREIIRMEWIGYNKLDTDKRIHPTQKPVALAEWFIRKFSKRNQNIIDLFGGSGSTLIACEQLNRKCFMMELDEKYCDVIIARWEKLTNLKAKKI